MSESLPLAEARSLVARAKAGDFGALEYLYRAYERSVYTFARRLTKSAEDAEDVLQETFLEVCRSLGRWRGDGSLWGWIRTIAASKALMRYRREKVREADELDDVAGPPAPHRPPPQGPEGRIGAAARAEPSGRVAPRRRGIHARGNRRVDGADGQLLEVAAGARAPEAA